MIPGPAADRFYQRESATSGVSAMSGTPEPETGLRLVPHEAGARRAGRGRSALLE
jgi:hypothetical protein